MQPPVGRDDAEAPAGEGKPDVVLQQGQEGSHRDVGPGESAVLAVRGDDIDEVHPALPAELPCEGVEVAGDDVLLVPVPDVAHLAHDARHHDERDRGHDPGRADPEQEKRLVASGAAPRCSGEVEEGQGQAQGGHARPVGQVAVLQPDDGAVDRGPTGQQEADETDQVAGQEHPGPCGAPPREEADRHDRRDGDPGGVDHHGRRVREGVGWSGGHPVPGASHQRGREGVDDHVLGELAQEVQPGALHRLGGVGPVVQDVRHEQDRKPEHGRPQPEQPAGAVPDAPVGEVDDGEVAEEREDQQRLDVEEQPEQDRRECRHEPAGLPPPEVADPRADREEERHLHGHLVQGGDPPHRGRQRGAGEPVEGARDEDGPAAAEERGEHPQGGEVREQQHPERDGRGEGPVELAGTLDRPGDEPAADHEVTVEGLEEVRHAAALGVDQQLEVVEVEPARVEGPGTERGGHQHHHQTGRDDRVGEPPTAVRRGRGCLFHGLDYPTPGTPVRGCRASR